MVILVSFDILIRGVDSIKSDAFAIVHIPKCAGTTLKIAALRYSDNFYDGEKYFADLSFYQKHRIIDSLYVWRHLRGFRGPRDTLIFSKKELSQTRNSGTHVMGHIELRNFHSAGFRKILVIVREPRIRAISQFRYWQTVYGDNVNIYGPAMKIQARLAKGTFEEYLDFLINHRGKFSKLYLNVDASITDMINLKFLKRQIRKSRQDVKFHFFWNYEINSALQQLVKTDLECKFEYANITDNDRKIPVTDSVYELLHEYAKPDMRSLDFLMSHGLTFRDRVSLDDEFNVYARSYFVRN